MSGLTGKAACRRAGSTPSEETLRVNLSRKFAKDSRKPNLKAKPAGRVGDLPVFKICLKLSLPAAGQEELQS
jgi:hypothetical protein